MESFNNFPSSSSLVSTRKWTYEVFLSFRGEDTRNNFVDYLYAALTQRGIHTFKDDDMLRRGKPISPELLKAIEESRSAVIVFSENYANSSWCLDELVKIMECHKLMGQRVLPVFYHVDPSDVRGQKGNFGTAFQQQQAKFRGEQDKMNMWREALVTASNLAGFSLSQSDGGESHFINKIVGDILGHIKPKPTENNLIGIETHMDALNSLLDLDATEEVRMVGIWGMGGIGKTTIAQAIFRRIAYKFDGSSFVKDVRQNCANNKDVCALQQKILSDVLMMNYFIIGDPEEGAVRIQDMFSQKKVILVLDDVDNLQQLEFLAAANTWFGPGSRIIITTRDQHLLSDAYATYKPNILLLDQAVQLFCRHAFKTNIPPDDYKELSYRAVCYAGYLPLALKVLGSFFYGRHIVVWESSLNRLGKEPNIEIFKTLRLSYDGLHPSEKKIFLDVACFFKGRDKEHVTRILDSFGFDPVIGISVLIEKSLITVCNKRLEMHDLIQEMGWQIVRDTFTNSRIWELEEMQNHIIQKTVQVFCFYNFRAHIWSELNLNSVEAIVLRDYKYNVDLYDKKLPSKAFKKMKNLRLLDIDSEFPSHEPTVLPDELRWLCWHKYPFIALPVARMRNLVGLEMVSSAIKRLWKGRKILPNLKFINLSESLHITRIPDVSGSPYIERFILANCMSLVEVHQSLGCHRRLVYLDMSGCCKLKYLPSPIEMESLETLILSNCHSLVKFPEVSQCMLKFSKIYLDHCDQIEDLPSSFRYLSSLSFISLVNCRNLKNIRNSICELRNLKSLYLHHCIKLEVLPEELGRMENLEELLLGFRYWPAFESTPESSKFHTFTGLYSLRKLDLRCRQIKEKDFPPNIHAFSLLEELNLSDNSQLTQLPAGISQLSNLKVLELNGCSGLQSLDNLPSRIQMLKASGCSSLQLIGNFAEDYQWLYKIWLFDCHGILQKQENERCIEKMLELPFIKKCAALNHRLSIGIPGNHVPIWFNVSRNGCNAVLKLPPRCYGKIMGFAVCGVFQRNWHSQYAFPRIIFKIVNEEKVIPMPEVNWSNASAVADSKNLWISYIPFSFFQQMYHDLQPEDWAHIDGNLVMTIMRTDGTRSVRCGAHIVYKEDVESVQECKTWISDYGNLLQVNDDDDYQKRRNYDTMVSGNTYVYEEKSDEKNLNPTYLPTWNPRHRRTRMTSRNIMGRTLMFAQCPLSPDSLASLRRGIIGSEATTEQIT